MSVLTAPCVPDPIEGDTGLCARDGSLAILLGALARDRDRSLGLDRAASERFDDDVVEGEIEAKAVLRDAEGHVLRIAVGDERKRHHVERHVIDDGWFRPYRRR